MEQRLLTLESLQTQGGGVEGPPTYPVKTKEKTDPSGSQIRGSGTLIPQPDALINLINNSEGVPICSQSC